MRVPRAPHRWQISPARAIAIQKELAGRVVKKWDGRLVRCIAGLDAAFSASHCIGAVVVWDVARKAVKEQHIAVCPLVFPYIPGLLSFREAPALLGALRKVRQAPDVLMCDGQGIAHPRRFGIASHIGIVAGLPSIGCAKSKLTGEYCEPGNGRGESAPLVDDGEVIGAVVRSKANTRPVYVSIGHLIDLEVVVEIVLGAATGHRLPEPTRLAHLLVTAVKKKVNPP